tara:strand:+ start:1741 stop:2091 length:351 start_codon:yes stop_codon:yes gene_type:complete
MTDEDVHVLNLLRHRVMQCSKGIKEFEGLDGGPYDSHIAITLSQREFLVEKRSRALYAMLLMNTCDGVDGAIRHLREKISADADDMHLKHTLDDLLRSKQAVFIHKAFQAKEPGDD